MPSSKVANKRSTAGAAIGVIAVGPIGAPGARTTAARPKDPAPTAGRFATAAVLVPWIEGAVPNGWNPHRPRSN
jgi:hypothetical protein